MTVDPDGTSTVALEATCAHRSCRTCVDFTSFPLCRRAERGISVLMEPIPSGHVISKKLTFVVLGLLMSGLMPRLVSPALFNARQASVQALASDDDHFAFGNSWCTAVYLQR